MNADAEWWSAWEFRSLLLGHHLERTTVLRRRGESLERRLLSKVQLGPGGCWRWVAHVDKGGYGRINLHGTIAYAHRASYEAFRKPIPDGLTIDHLCRVRDCINPAHLEAVDERTNILRGTSPMAINAAKTHCVRGHLFSAENTYHHPAGGRGCRTCRKHLKRAWDEAQKTPEPAQRLDSIRAGSD